MRAARGYFSTKEAMKKVFDFSQACAMVKF